MKKTLSNATPRRLFFPRLAKKFHGQVTRAHPRGQYGQARILDLVGGAVDTKQIAFLLYEKGVVRVMNSIVSTRAVLYENRWSALS